MKFLVKFDIIDLSDEAQQGFAEDVISKEEETVEANSVAQAISVIRAQYANPEMFIGIYFKECNWIE
jgi:hypothetical protein